MLIILWMLSGNIISRKNIQAYKNSSLDLVKVKKVRVERINAEKVDQVLVVNAELEPIRQIELRAQISSRVVKLPVKKGDVVRAEEVVIELDVEDRLAQFERAKAKRIKLKLDVDGAQQLQNKALQSVLRLREAEAALAEAEADVKRAQLELQNTHIKTPFPGVIENRYVELGSHLERGDPMALVVDRSKLKAVGKLSQIDVEKVSLGQHVSVELLNGNTAEGVVTYISYVGDKHTHSFRVEAELPNTGGKLNAGVSAVMRINIGQETAHYLASSLLSLNDKDMIGVKVVNIDGYVDFVPISIVRTDENGVWVKGLPPQTWVITQGQGFVKSGEAVSTVPIIGS
ncbi:MAG: efflux RND transporter periplasmic adaptor subunit [Candidatus Thiodiazotropha sp.]